MGFAHGELLKEKAKNMMDDVWKYLEEQVVSDVTVLQHSGGPLHD